MCLLIYAFKNETVGKGMGRDGISISDDKRVRPLRSSVHHKMALVYQLY
jgi:hypothetical protein